MGSMKTISTAMSLLTVLISVIYTYYLLAFIDASGFLWVLWAISMIIMFVTTMLSTYARDEYYAEQFKRMMEK